MEIVETERFRQAKQRMLSKREFQFIQRQMLSPTRLVPTIRRSGGIRRLVWVGTIKGRRRKMQILYYYRELSAAGRGNGSVDRGNESLDRVNRSLDEPAMGSVDSVREHSVQTGDLEQITLLHVCQLRDTGGLSVDQIRRMRSAVREELKQFS